MWYAAIGALCFSLSLTIAPVRHGIASGIAIVSYPFVYVQDMLFRTYRALTDGVTSDAHLRRELAWYRDMYTRMRADNVRLQASLAYTQAIEELAAFSRRYDTTYGIIAAIIFRQCTQDQHMCIIDAGSNRDIVPDMIVVYHNMLVGRVEAVYPYYSRVRLVTDRRCHVPVVCSTTQTRAIHAGINEQDTSTLLYVSHLAQLQPGESVLTRSSGLVYPDGFGVGRVISYVPNGLYHDVVVEPYVDIYDIDYCTVIQPGAEHTISVR